MPVDDFAWDLIQALYTQSSYPATLDTTDLLAFQRLFELSELALQQLDRWDHLDSRTTAAVILAQVDEMLREVGRLSPRVNPVVQWFETERLRIPPQAAEQTLQQTQKLFADLHLIATVYRRYQDRVSEHQRVSALCTDLVPKLREFDFASVQNEFQQLVGALHELSRHSTKVGNRSWSTLLSSLNAALERRDMIEIADQLEYVLVPALS